MRITNALQGTGLKNIPLAKRVYDWGLLHFDIPQHVTGGRLYPIYDPGTDSVCYYTPDYEPHITTAITTHTQPGATVIDIGASIGYHTLAAAHATTPRGRVHAYEPAAARRRGLHRNLHENAYEHVTTHDYRLGRGDGTRLAAHKPDVVKIDVEGAEADILPALAHAMHEHHPTIIVEFHWPHLTTEDMHTILAQLERTSYNSDHATQDDTLEDWRQVGNREARSHYILTPGDG